MMTVGFGLMLAIGFYLSAKIKFQKAELTAPVFTG